MTISLTLDKEIEADIRKRWLAIFTPEELNLTPSQVYDDVNFLIFQLDRFQKAYNARVNEPQNEAGETAAEPEDYIDALKAELALREQRISELEARCDAARLLATERQSTIVALRRANEESQEQTIRAINDVVVNRHQQFKMAAELMNALEAASREDEGK